MFRQWFGMVMFAGMGSLAAADTDWTQFRGPQGNGQISSAKLPEEISEKAIAWKVKVPGSGWAQPIVIGDKIFVATAVTDPPYLPKNMMSGVMAPQSRPDPNVKGPTPGPNIQIEWQLLCMNLKTGKTEWSQTIAKGKPKYAIHPSNSFATETPIADAERVYTYFGTAGILAALDHTGKEVWRKDVGVYPAGSNFGPGASPILHDGKIFLPILNEEKAVTICYEAKTGKELYTIEREKVGTSWSSPLIWKNKSRTELVICGRGSVSAHDLSNGKELWRLGGIDSSFSSSPAATEDILVFGNGGPGSVSPLFGVKAGAKGDITLSQGENNNEWVAFYKTGAAPGMASPISLGKYIYVLNRGGLSCYEATTGKELYKERLPRTRTVAASPFAVDDKLVFLDEGGEVLIVKAGPEFEVLTQGKIEDTFWASPTPTSAGLLLRGVEAMYLLK